MGEETIDQQILNDRIQKFSQDFEKLQQQHGIVVLPVLRYSKHGLIPELNYADKQMVENQLKEMAGQQQVVKPE